MLITAYGTINHAVKAVRMGANDYVTKPYEQEELLLAVEKSLGSQQMWLENKRLKNALGDMHKMVDMVGKSAKMQQVFSRVRKLSDTEATILVSGESGTGKELVARALHVLSKRKEQPFVAVNCAAIPHTLWEAEFFGAEKGAYTGSDDLRIGRFEAAHGGTIFLDEIGELPLTVAAKVITNITGRGDNKGRWSR